MALIDSSQILLQISPSEPPSPPPGQEVIVKQGSISHLKNLDAGKASWGLEAGSDLPSNVALGTPVDKIATE